MIRVPFPAAPAISLRPDDVSVSRVHLNAQVLSYADRARFEITTEGREALGLVEYPRPRCGLLTSEMAQREREMRATMPELQRAPANYARFRDDRGSHR